MRASSAPATAADVGVDTDAALRAFGEWRAGEDEFTLGVEEEAFLLEPGSGEIAHRSADVLPLLRERLDTVTAETHDSAFEIATSPTRSVAGAGAELRD